MNEERERIIEKALKIRELVNRGIDGEKASAIERLNSYKEKHGITDEELNSFKNIDDEWWNNLSNEERGSKFSIWFKNSVSIYKGKPVIFYHKSRTEEKFTEFKNDLGNKLYNDDTNYGFHFVHHEDKNSIQHIGKYQYFDKLIDGVDFLVYLRMLNPYYIYARLDGNSYGQNGEPYRPINITKNLVESLMAHEYDSIIILNEVGYNTYVVFKSNQIKSVENNGEYSLESNDIMN